MITIDYDKCTISFPDDTFTSDKIDFSITSDGSQYEFRMPSSVFQGLSSAVLHDFVDRVSVLANSSFSVIGDS